MKYLKNLGMSLLCISSTILVLTFIITIFSYFNIINDKTVSILKIIIPILSLFIGGFFIGKKSLKKGFIEGIKLGSITSIILILININNFELKSLLFYLILIITSSLGSMIGINKKRDK